LHARSKGRRSVAALAAAALALAGVLAVAGCGPRAGRVGGGNSSGNSNGQQGPAPTLPAPAGQPGGGTTVDTSALDGELRSIDALLSDADAELANADKTPEDAD